MNRWIALVGSLVFSAVSGAPLQGAEERVDFGIEAQWEGFRNRLLPVPLPITRQDFGWVAAGEGKTGGKVGGWIQRSVQPASYAKAIPVCTLDQRLAASGKFHVTEDDGGSGMMFGWFNESSRGWRMPNSLTFRVDGNGSRYWVFYEYGTRAWRTGGGGCFEGERYQTTTTKPFKADGTEHSWSLSYDPQGAEGNGLITFVLDGKSYTQPLAPGHKLDGAEFNRFGMVNQQLTGGGMRVFFSGLVLEGEPIDLSRDPGWVAQSNRVEYPNRALRPFHDFGWSPASQPGGKGEIGGMIWRDVKPAYYGAKTDALTLEDELVATGTIVFRGAGSDSGAYLGWFNAETKKDPEVKEQQAPKNILAILIEGPSRIGHYFRPEIRTANGAGAAAGDGPIIRPDGAKHRWEMRYSPSETDGSGRVTVKLDDKEQTITLKPEHRKVGAMFNRFGLFNCQTGGHYVDVAMDELTFTRTR